MKTLSIILLTVTCLTLFSFTNKNYNPSGKAGLNFFNSDLLPVSVLKLDANNISAWFRNNGNFNRDPVTGNAGFEWPKGSANYARYSSGLWMGCISNGDTLTAIAEYAYDYSPGYVDNAGQPQGINDSLYRIYNITRGDTLSYDYLHWPVNQGAYVNAQGKPFFSGTQTMFYSYTDAYPHQSNNTSDSSLKAVILQTNWCYTNSGLRDVQFIEFKIINRSSNIWEDAYFSFWTDDDLGSPLDDVIACDTLRNIGFTYNATNNDPVYGTSPPAVGTMLLRSPVVFTGNSNDTAKYYNPPGSQNLVVKAGYKFTGMNVFNTYNNASPQPSDPQINSETYRVISGLWRSGQSWINPVNNQPTKLAYSGDPTTGTGWVMTGSADRRFLLGVGPLNMSPNDTQSVIFAQLIARGSSNLNSILQLKNLTDLVQEFYNTNFQSVLSVNNISTEIPASFTLSQNYPNPFNPTTVIRYSLSGNHFTTLKVFDALGKEIVTLINEKQNPGTYEAEFDGSGLPSGVYFYKLTAGGFSDTKRMILLK